MAVPIVYDAVKGYHQTRYFQIKVGLGRKRPSARQEDKVFCYNDA